MFKLIGIKLLAFGLFAAVYIPALRVLEAQEPEKPLRELFVPFEELDVLLGSDARRVYMTRGEYEELLVKARIEPNKIPPAKLALLVANYQADIGEGRATIRGDLQLEVLDAGIQVLVLPFSGVGVRAALLDGGPASLAKNDQGQTWLFVEGVGKHRLTLDLVMPIATDAAQQTLQFQIPTAPTGELNITVPGNIEIKSGAAVVSREVDEASGTTKFKILPTAAPMSMVMSLNNRKLRDQSTVVARGVLIAEVTQAYERLHATMSMGVLNGAVDEFRFAIDDDLEVNSVTSELLSRWSIEKVDGKQQLVVTLRTTTTDRTVVNVRLDRTTRKLDAWRMPKFEPVAVAGYSSVVGLLSEERLDVSVIEPSSLIAIDSTLLTSALPASLLAAEPGAPKLNAIAAYYAAQAQYSLTARFEVKLPRVTVGSNTLLTISDSGLEVEGGFTLMPKNEKLFFFEFECPAIWTINWVKTAEQQPLKFDRFSPPDANAGQLVRIRVSLPSGIAAGGQQAILFRAQRTPDNWLTKWTTQSIELPNFRVLNTQNQYGAVAVAVQDELLVTPESTEGLLVMNADEKGRFQLAETDTAVAYRFESAEWKATMNVTRTTPRLVAQVLSFFQISPDALTSHTEITYDIKQARVQAVALTLPESTPTEVAIRGIGDTVVKETSSSAVDGRRIWTVQLAERKFGAIRLAVDFTEPLNLEKSTEITLPIARGQDIAYQSGTIAVEGHPELEIDVTQHPRAVDIGELVDAEYQVGKRLIGVFGYVGVADITISKVARRPVHRLPTTIVERAELVTLVSVHGASQTAARFKLRTKAAYIESRLPANAVLWSVLLDGKPALPQREQDRVLIALPSNKQLTNRDLQLVFESPTNEVMLRGEIGVLAPVLFERGDIEAENVEIPIADMKWKLVLPPGYRIALTHGNLKREGTYDSEFILNWLLGKLWEFGGGRTRVLPSIAMASRYKAVKDAMLSSEDADYAVPLAMPRPPFGNLDIDARDRKQLSDIKKGSGMGGMGMGGAGMEGGADPFGDANAAFDPQSVIKGESASDDLSGRLPAMEGAADSKPGNPQATAKANIWAMEGVRSLSISLDNQIAGLAYSFNSLGLDPGARVTIVHQTRLNWLAIAVGLVIFAAGLVFVPARRAARVRYFFAVALIACLAPPVTGWTVELEPITAAAIIALFLLAAVLLLLELANRMTVRMPRGTMETSSATQNAKQVPSSTATTMLLCIATAGSLQSSACAQSQPAASDLQPGQVITSAEQFSRLFNALTDGGKVTLPPDAVIIPFDVTQPGKLKETDKLLVPYDKYVELWNRANPEKRIVDPSLPANFGWSAASYSVTLEGNESLRMTGSLTIDQYTDKEIAIPLALAGCVIESATLEGKPPRLQVVSGGPQPANPQAAQMPVQPAPPASMYVLYTHGKGRKQLKLQLRWQLDKRSGWRAIEGRLPTTPASELTIAVPKPKTEVRLAGGFDRGNFETANENEKIVTTLASDGRLSLNWRDKITEASIDQGLTVQARSVFDVQEDALKLAWHGQFEFRRGRRESFTLHVPKDYLVEKVVGGNIRGWTVKATDTTQQVDVELLKAVTDRETLVVFISKQTAMDVQATTQVPLKQISVPQITVPDAMLHQGHVAVRRSILLDVRADATTGLTRMESVDESAWLAAHEIASILPIKVYQAYRYSQVPFDLNLSVSAIQSKLRVQSQTLMRISQLERTLETRLLISGSDRPIYRLQIALPKEWKLQTPEVPGSFQWSLTTSGDRQLMQIYLANGQSTEFPVILRGKISSEVQANVPIPLPQIEVIDAQRQGGAIVVQADPSYEVRAENLQGCEPALLDSVKSWLANKQREAARTVIRFEAPQYNGQLQVSSRVPIITSYSVTNVRVTDRSIEETLFIEANIRSAGIREFVFQMPASMSTAKIQAPHVRQKIIQPVPDDAGRVRVQLLLQDAIMGQFRVVVEHDRELTSGPHSAPLPTIETGTTDRRLVTLENVGRDELVTEQTESYEPLDRSQLQQRFQANLLGGRSSQAYLAKEGAVNPSLTYSTKSRTALVTAGARIGLAQTLLVVDEMGTYRATQEYRVENRTEPFLEIELPNGARMWTVQVAGEPVKPALAAAGVTSTNQRVRIPLIKTAEGDLDYPVVIKYGGQIKTPSWLSRVEFPLIHTLNINVELSQVRLRLPEAYDWVNFNGTLGRVQSESELQAGWLSYRTRQLTELSQLLDSKGSSASDYTKARVLNNLSTLQSTIQQNNMYFSQQEIVSEEFKKQLSSNSAALQSAQQQASQVQQGQIVEGRGNRDLLNDLYGTQSNGRSFNALGDLGLNFAAPSAVAEATTSKVEEVNQQNSWLSQNKLDNNPAGDATRLQIEEKVQSAKSQSQLPQLETPRTLARQAGGNEAKNEPQSNERQSDVTQNDVTQNAGKKLSGPQPSQSNDSQAARYGRRLQSQNPNLNGQQMAEQPSNQMAARSFANPSATGGGGMSSYGMDMGGFKGGMSGGMGMGMQMPQNKPTSPGQPDQSELGTQNPLGNDPFSNPDRFFNGEANTAAFMASLDVELPVRGREYFFTTPLGEVELSAQGIATRFYQRLYAILGVLGVAVGAWMIYLLCVRMYQTRLGTTVLFSGLLLFGVISLAQGYLPFYGGLALLAALVLIVTRLEMRAPQIT